MVAESNSNNIKCKYKNVNHITIFISFIFDQTIINHLKFVFDYNTKYHFHINNNKLYGIK